MPCPLLVLSRVEKDFSDKYSADIHRPQSRLRLWRRCPVPRHRLCLRLHLLLLPSLPFPSFPSSNAPVSMVKGKRERKLLALTGAAALAAVALNLAISVMNAHRMKKKRRELPGSNVRINLTASEITALADEIIAKSKKTLDLVASLPDDKVTYMNVISVLAELDAKQFSLVQSCIFPKMVSVSDDVRKASAEAERKLDSHFLACRKREDIYHVIVTFLDKGECLPPEAKRYIEGMVGEFERNGVNLNSAKRREVESLRSQINELSLKYIENLNKDASILLFDESELAGVPPEFIKSLGRSENGKLKIFLRSSHISIILEHCKIGRTRKLVAVTHGQRCGKDNLYILENLVELRRKFAKLLGYSSFAEYAIEPRMAKIPAKVFDFLENMSLNLSDLATKELDILKCLKENEEGISEFGTDDMLYYMKRAEERYLDSDYDVLNQLFSLDMVLSATLNIFQDLFGLRFEKVEHAEVWHSTVSLFAVSDCSSSELLGYFYLDLFCREGKYAHTCVLALQNGCLLSNGIRQIPIALLISQFPKQVDGIPEKLHFSEVVSLFHEFGHVVHLICNRASFSKFSGLRIDADFVEIPGQMFENWCYERSFLRLMSSFKQDQCNTTTAYEEGICKALKRRRDMFSGLKLKQEILLCLIDQIIHSSESVDIVDLVKHLHPKVMLGIPLLDGINPDSCFPTLAVGYEAVCYSSLWSQVCAVDVFSSKFLDDPLNHYAGLQFRNKVFAPGGASDPQEILKDYLGREPSAIAYIRSKTQNSLAYCF